MVTFRQLDGGRELGNSCSLDEWYHSVRDVPLDELRVEDICVACRQEVFLLHVLPLALKALSDDPNAGGSYDGELASALSKIADRFWLETPQFMAETRAGLTKALPFFDADVREEVNGFLSKNDVGMRGREACK